MRTTCRIMNRCCALLLFSLIILTGPMVFPAPAQPLSAPLMNATTPVNINGAIDPMEWENAGATASTFTLQDFGGTNRTVTVYALHDNANLYLGFMVEDQTRTDDPTIGTQDDGVILLFDPGTGAIPDKSGTVLADDTGYSYFVIPNTATPSQTDATVTGNAHSPSGGMWSTTAGMPGGGVNAQFSNTTDAGGVEQGWQMEILIPFTALNSIDPHTHSQIGFAFFIVNDWGDTSVNGTIGDNDTDGFLAYPAGLAGALAVGTPIITPANPVSSLVNSGNFKVPSGWETIILERPQILVTPTSLNFGAVRKDTTSTPIALSVQNTGTAGTTLKYTLPALSAPYSYTAMGTPDPGTEHTLPAGAPAHTYQIQFSPTVEGVVPTQTKTITSNDQNVDFILDGEGGLPHLAVTGSTSGAPPTLTLDFGKVTVNTASTESLMIGNTGTVPLDITHITKSGSGAISVTAPGGGTIANILNGAPQPLTIRCNPPSVGAVAATVKFDTDDPAYQIAGSGNDITVNVTCEGATREVVLALDASGSMRVRKPDGSLTEEFNSSRWKDLEQQVSLFAQVLTEYGAGKGTFNGVLFPNKDDTAETGKVFPNMATINASNKAQFDTALSSVPKMGLVLNHGTPMGAGLRDAVNQFATANSRRALLLFSDGAQNYGPAPSDFYAAAINSGARIYTIGYGVRGASEVDLDLLAEIAALTEQPGEDNSFEVNSDVLFDLNKTIKYILEDDLGLDLIVDPEGVIAAGQQITREVTVSDMTQQLYFHVSWDTYQADRLQVELVTPDCRLITPSTAASDARVRYLSQKKFKTYTIKGSLVKAGKWKVIVRAPGTLGAGEPYSYGLLGDTRLRLNPIFSKSKYVAGDEIKIKAVLQGNGAPIKNAIVHMAMDSPKQSLANWLALNYVSPQLMAKVHVPILEARTTKNAPMAAAVGASQPAAASALAASAIETRTLLTKKAYILKNVIGINPPLETVSSHMYLYDDGVTGGDEVANDGIYTATMKNTTVAGTYAFRIYASGKTPGGYDFTREVHAQRQVNAGLSIKDINFHYTYTKQLIKGQYRDAVVVSISGKDAYGNVSVNNQIIKDLHFRAVNGTPWGTVRNNGDGSFSQTILLEHAKKSPKVFLIDKKHQVTRDYEIPVVSDLTFANEVVRYKAGKEGQEDFNTYTKPQSALGPPAKNKLVSLGGGGSLTVEVKEKDICDGPGADIVIYETVKLPNRFETPDAYTVEVLTKNGYVGLGTAGGGTAQFDLADKKIRRARAIRITDTSGRVADYSGMAIHTPGADIEAVGVKYARDSSGYFPWEGGCFIGNLWGK